MSLTNKTITERRSPFAIGDRVRIIDSGYLRSNSSQLREIIGKEGIIIGGRIMKKQGCYQYDIDVTLSDRIVQVQCYYDNGVSEIKRVHGISEDFDYDCIYTRKRFKGRE